MANVAVDVLLAAGVAAELLCVVGVVLMRTVYARLHYAAAATTVPAWLVLAAVIVREHVSSGGLQAIGAVAILFLLNPLLVMATARAARECEDGT
jgi:monovalent cation/proton antiporter MnhG/PhaG subunit